MKFLATLLTIMLCGFYGISQVGVGTTNPQAQLEVANGNVRFSSYGNGTQTSTNLQYILGVEADGDVVETNALSVDRPGLQYYFWNTANVSTPNIGVPRNLGRPEGSGLWTGNLDDAARAALAPDNDGYIIRFVGTIKVTNTNSFRFNATSDDGTRIYIDDMLILDNWFQQAATTRTNIVTLARGEHRIEFWYYENSGGQFMEFTWGPNPEGFAVNSVINANQFFVK